ncbi:post-transcriptional regulator [Lysinibacillus sp. LZ02]|uniref:post-transcriptional regulator n=1 Tax=Lysinibacillus sp. LZ02 TaxID=3420668 RepID=UPI003D35A02D
MAVPYESLYRKMQLVLQSKLEEFELYEYDAITMEQLWQYCVEKKWRKKVVEELPLHVVVSTIFSITPSELLNHVQIKELQFNDGIIDLNAEDLEALLGPKKKE